MGSVNELMTELADAVRLKSGASGEMTIKQMVTAMAGITVADDIGFTCGTVNRFCKGHSAWTGPCPRCRPFCQSRLC